MRMLDASTQSSQPTAVGIVAPLYEKVRCIKPKSYRKTFQALTLVRFSLFPVLIGMILTNSSGCTNSVPHRCIPHALHNSLPKLVHFSWITGTKCCRNSRAVIHPSLQFKLTNELLSIGLDASMSHLVSPYVRFVQVMNKMYGQFDQKIPLRLGVVRVVQPIIKIRMGPEPKHRVRAVLTPERLLPFLQKDGAKRNTGENVAGLHHHFSLGQRGGTSRCLPCQNFAVLVPVRASGRRGSVRNQLIATTTTLYRQLILPCSGQCSLLITELRLGLRLGRSRRWCLLLEKVENILLLHGVGVCRRKGDGHLPFCLQKKRDKPEGRREWTRCQRKEESDQLGA